MLSLYRLLILVLLILIYMAVLRNEPKPTTQPYVQKEDNIQRDVVYTDGV